MEGLVRSLAAGPEIQGPSSNTVKVARIVLAWPACCPKIVGA